MIQIASFVIKRPEIIGSQTVSKAARLFVTSSMYENIRWPLDSMIRSFPGTIARAVAEADRSS